MKRSVILLGCMTLLPAVAAAFQPLVTDDTGTQGAKGNQIEFSYLKSDEEEPGNTAVTHSFPLVYTRGLTDALDVYAGASYVSFRPPAPDPEGNGAGNVVVGLKWRFYDNESDKLSLALKPEIRLPVSESAESQGLGNGRTNGSVALILTKETGFGAVHANLAVSTYRFALQANEDYHRDTLWRFSVAPVVDIAEGWKVALDAGLVTNPHQAEHAGMGYVELGAIYSPTKDLDFALGFIRDVHHENHRVFSVTAGITWRFR